MAGKEFSQITNIVGQLDKKGIAKITIHHCELKSQNLLVQPVVCMHVIDSNNGSYVKKQDRERAVVSYYENQRSDIDYIMPIMTQTCAVQGEKSQLLSWEESFILNESLDYLLRTDLNIILFFEVIDLIPLSVTKCHYERLNENGMQKIAWAFLKVLGSNNITNTGAKMRLQLYKPYHSKKKKKLSKTEVFQWWAKKSRIPLQASLYISFEPDEAVSIEPALRSMLPLQEEVGTSKEEQVTGVCIDAAKHSQNNSFMAIPNKTIISLETGNDDVKWFRKEGEACKIPTKLCLSMESTNYCQILKFSSTGRMLVTGCEASGQYYLSYYEISSGKMLHKNLAHSDAIYDLDWSQDDHNLLSASADYSVKLWGIKPLILVSAFIHPSFVYSAKFQPSKKNILVTACNDHVIRIWTYNKSVQLLQELEGHSTSVNSLCWNNMKMRLFSADSIGEIKVWKTLNNTNKVFDHYVLDVDLSCQEIKFKGSAGAAGFKNTIFYRGIPIEKIECHSSKDVLFLFCGDANVRLLDLSVGTIITTYSITKTQSVVKGCCSPCGNLLFLCNDDGSLSVWNQNSSKIVAILPNTLHTCHLTCIDYHPFDHMLVLSTSEENGAIYVYTYDKSVPLLETNEPATPQKSLKRSELNAGYSTLTPSEYSPVKERKKLNNSLKSDMYNTETSSDEGFAKLSSKALNFKRYSSEKTFEKSKAHTGASGKTESFTAIITKSGQFEVIGVAETCTESDAYGSGNATQTGDPGIQQKSSKRSQRRKKLREIDKATF